MEANQVKLMPGTSGPSRYFPFARNGNVLLGIRPQHIADGESMDIEGTTYFAARLRSAPEDGLFAAEDAAKTVVSFPNNPPNLWDAWPSVTWEKASPKRASTTVGVLLNGKFKGTTEEKETLLKQIANGQLTGRMAEYLIELAGHENMIVGYRELKAWLDGQYNPIIEGIIDSVEKHEKLKTAAKETIGVFGMQAALLQKVYGQNEAAQTVFEDAEGEVVASGEEALAGAEEPVDGEAEVETDTEA